MSFEAFLVAGARPNFVKIAPLVAALRADGRVRPRLVHTGQHYDDAMSAAFFRELEIPDPDVHLGVGSGTHAAMTGAVMAALEGLVEAERPNIVITVGDVNSTLAAALVAAKAGVPQAHVEAGLRSRDPAMPEEVNRVVTDRLADLLFTHSSEADDNLRAEGVADVRIHFVGNVMIDTLLRARPGWQGRAAKTLPHLPERYGVVTLHRPANVDDAAGLAAVVAALDATASDVPLVFPVHPRTRARLAAMSASAALRLVDPLPYTAFLDLVEHAAVVLTDSGGIQEETTVLGVPCLTLRDNTERPVTVRAGTNVLLGTNPSAIRPAVQRVLNSPRPEPFAPPLWDGHAAERIAAIVADYCATSHPLRLAA